MRLDGKKVIITGASSGIGRVCAEGFAKEGANLILCGRHESRLQEVSDILTSTYGIQVLPLIFDITDATAVEKSVMDLPSPWQKIDILINSVLLIKPQAR